MVPAFMTVRQSKRTSGTRCAISSRFRPLAERPKRRTRRRRRGCERRQPEDLGVKLATTDDYVLGVAEMVTFADVPLLHAASIAAGCVVSPVCRTELGAVPSAPADSFGRRLTRPGSWPSPAGDAIRAS